MRPRYLCHLLGHRRGPVCGRCGAVDPTTPRIHALADKYAREYGHLHPIVAELRELGGEA